MKRYLHLMMVLCLSTTPVFADNTADTVKALEKRVASLEAQVAKKISRCHLTYQFHATRHFVCDAGTVARSVRTLMSGVVVLECYYYQIQCFIKPETDGSEGADAEGDDS